MDTSEAPNWIGEANPAIEKLSSALVPSAELCRRACYEEV